MRQRAFTFVLEVVVCAASSWAAQARPGERADGRTDAVSTSEVLAIESTMTVKPAPPVGLAAVPGNAQVRLSWTAAIDGTSYSVYRGLSVDRESRTPLATGLNTTAYLDSGLTNGQTYYYKVAAARGPVMSAPSDEVSATPSGKLTALVLPALTHSSGSVLYQAADSVVADAGLTVGGTAAVAVKAGKHVVLGPGFHAKAVVPGIITFHAIVGR